MNKWDCDHPGCRNTAIGVGGAVGLRAIGWYFEPGPRVLCPAHRPDPIPCTEKDGPASCSLCTAYAEARALQADIEESLRRLADGEARR